MNVSSIAMDLGSPEGDRTVYSLMDCQGRVLAVQDEPFIEHPDTLLYINRSVRTLSQTTKADDHE